MRNIHVGELKKRTLPQNSNPVLLGRAGEKQKNQPAHIVEKILEGLTRSRSAVPRKNLTVGTVKLANIRNGIRILVLQGEVVQLILRDKYASELEKKVKELEERIKNIKEVL